MPRDLAIGNGRLLVAFDGDYRVRDIYFPHVGLWNHAGHDPFRFGIWVDGAFDWITARNWNGTLRYRPDTLVSDVRLVNDELGLELICADAVDFHRPIYVRRMVVRDLRGAPRHVKLFFHHDFYLFRDGVGDTTYFDPLTRGIVHHKRDVLFMANAWAGEQPGFDAVSTGTKHLHGLEGTWRDAEDGNLSGNAIAQGLVDSTGGVDVRVPAGGDAVAHYWLAVGDEFFAVKDENDMVVRRGPDALIERTKHYWRHWVTREDLDFTGLDPAVRDLYRRSMLIVRTQTDDDGAIIAANDSDILQFGRDTYTYMWPRDGALVVHVLIQGDHRELARRFFDFCLRTIQPGGFMLHKYNPDGTPGSSWHPWADADGNRILPIQEDETSLVLWALGAYDERFKDTEVVKPLYAPLIKRAADFMVRFRHRETGLPAPSWDLWEERYGIHTFTVASVYGGLRAAAAFARAFGEEAAADEYDSAAAEIREAAFEHLYDEGEQRFIRRLEVADDGALIPDMTIDASVCGVWRFGLCEPTDERCVSTMHSLRDRLWVKTDIGGVARYEDDYYHRVSDDIERIPGNPWFICTLWLAQWEAAAAQTMDDLERAHELMRWVVDRALPSGTLAEQVHPLTGQPLSVSPLTWSHAEFADTVQQYVTRARELRGRGG